LFRSENFFRTTQELEYLFFLSRKARIFFHRPKSNYCMVPSTAHIRLSMDYVIL
jgi:hypothetical protein